MTDAQPFDRIITANAERPALQAEWDRQRATARLIVHQFAAGYDTMLLADEVGMGKTYVALSVIAHHVMQTVSNDRKVLLVVPPSPVLKVKWEQEILSFNDKYLVGTARMKGLRPISVNSYWDLLRNLHDYEGVDDKYRVDEAERHWFIFCLFEWASARGRLGKSPRRWPVIREYDTEGTDYFHFCSQYSVQALRRFLDEKYKGQSHTMDDLFRQLAADTFANWMVANLLKEFAPRQDHFEPNVFIMGMNALNRPKIDEFRNRQLTRFLVGLLLARRWEDTRRFYVEGFEKARVLPEKGAGHWDKYVDRMLELSRIDYCGLKDAAQEVINTEDVRARWDALAHDIRTGNTRAVQLFAADLADRVFRAKLSRVGIGLAVIDEVHNWKNGGNGATAFGTNFTPCIPTKLIMSATPFQIGEQEMRTLFGFAGTPGGRTVKTITGMFEENGPVVRCLDASRGFAKAWAGLTMVPAHIQEFRKRFHGVTPDCLQDLVQSTAADASCSDGIREFATRLANYRAAVDALQSQLREVVVRHTKPRKKRDFHIGRDFGRVRTEAARNALYPTCGYADEDNALLNFIGMRLDQLLRRELKGAEEANARLLGGITSSTRAFLEGAGSKRFHEGSTGEAAQYVTLFESVLKGRPHPKVAATVERAFQNFVDGRKTLIFCERTATLAEIGDLLNARIDAHLETQTSDSALKRETLLKNAGFVDNLWWISLGYALGNSQHWAELNERELEAAARFAADRLAAVRAQATPRRVIRLVDAYMMASALRHGLLKGTAWQTAGLLFERLYSLLAAEADTSTLSSYLNTVAPAGMDRIEEATEEETAEDIDDVIRKQYHSRQNLWCAGDSDFHTLLWNLLDSEAVAIAQSAQPADMNAPEVRLGDAQACLAFADVLADLMAGLRKVVLRDDLIRRYAAFGERLAESQYVQLREGFARMPLGHGETMLARTKRFLSVLLEHNGSISQAALLNSKRKSLWQGVFAKDVKYVARLWGDTDPTRRVSLCAAFNSPLLPDILVRSAIGSEGIDLHLHCAEVIHHDLPWNPAKLEQRIGRIDRVNSLADSTPGATIAIGIPFLEQNYEKFQYEVVLSRAQKFEVLLGRPDYRTAETEEENFDTLETDVQASGDAEVGRSDEILVALPDAVVDYLKIDLTLAGRS